MEWEFSRSRAVIRLFRCAAYSLRMVRSGHFFVVSGFCIHLSYARNSKWLPFFWRRFWRIWPPYFIALLLFFVSDLALGQLRNYPIFQLFSHSLLIHNFWSHTHFAINPSFWSIAVEAQLYLIYPLLIVMQSRSGWRYSLLIALGIEIFLNLGASLIFHATSITFPRLLGQGPFAYWFSWSIGAWIAHAYLRGLPIQWLKYCHPAVMGAAVIFSWSYQPIEPLIFLLISCLTASLMVKRLNRASNAIQPGNAVIRVLECTGKN
jgi:peptidoglycan/LPS O-acetylase OafA/YrhL